MASVADFVLNQACNVEIVHVRAYRTANDGETLKYGEDYVYNQCFVEVPICHGDSSFPHHALRIYRWQLADFIRHLQAVQSELTE